MIPGPSTVRYAIYFTPPEDDALTHHASRWLGRDAFSGAGLPQPVLDGFGPEDIAAFTAEPRRYGFHATLKAPFALASGRTEVDLLASFAAFCRQTEGLVIPRLAIVRIGAFFALVPADLHQPLQDFAAAVVEAFEPFRAPLSPEDIARRKPDRLSPRQRDLLMTWGYPYVFEEFRFHMTLTGAVDPSRADALAVGLATHFADFIDIPLPVTGLGLFVEDAPGNPFVLRRWMPLPMPERKDQ